MASTLRPQFFCTRPNGTLTPLIAVDELPAHVSIRGVPRVLAASDTQGMTSLGTVNPRAHFYTVDGTSPRASQSSYGRDDLQSSLLKLVSDETLPPTQRLALHTLLQQGLTHGWNAPTNGATNGWVVPTSGGPGGHRQHGGHHFNPKKEFCSYWIRHGECDYQQQGCLYKHEMPLDPVMLDKLGLRDIPRWYRDKYNVPSLLPNGAGAGAGAAHTRSIAQGQHWKDDGADYGAIKSIQYPSRLEINSASDTSDVEKTTKQKPASYVPPVPQHPTAMAPGHVRPTYAAVGSFKDQTSQRHGMKQGPHPNNLLHKKIDLLSFDPVQDPSALSPMNGPAGELSYPDQEKTSVVEEADRRQREEFVRSLQSLMPASVAANPEYQQNTPIDTDSNNRAKRFQKSRRLYQPRGQGHHEAMEPTSFKTFHNNATAFAASMPKNMGHQGMGNSGLSSPLAGPVLQGAMSSDPPTRVATPSIHSHTSLSSESSPRGYAKRFKEREAKQQFPVPGPIGSKRIYKKRSVGSSEDEMYTHPGK